MNEEECNAKPADPVDVDVANLSHALKLQEVVAKNEQYGERSEHVEIR